MEIKRFYKACDGLITGTEQQKKEQISKLERSGNWIAETKQDGIWFVLFENTGKGFTRRANEKEHHLPVFHEDTILIGELGESTERAVAEKEKIGHSFIDVFDIVRVKGTDVTKENLIKRKNILKEWLEIKSNYSDFYRYVEPHERDFVQLYEKAEEGIVLKLKDQPYTAYDYDWIKVKKEFTWDFVIVDFELSTAESKMSTPTAKNFIAGQFIGNKLKPMVKVPISIDLGMDVAKNPDKYINQVIEIRGFSRTKTGSVRSPQLVRIRDDKPVNECTLDVTI